MPVRWGARVGLNMRLCYVTTVLAALALRSAAEQPRRDPTDWREGRDLANSRPLQEYFEPEPTDTDIVQAYAQHQPPLLPPGALQKERRRVRYNKRNPHQLPSEIASQMMLRASRSNRPYDVPQIGKFSSYLFHYIHYIGLYI